MSKMIKYNINDRVYCINKEEHQIECGTIQKIIIEKEKINYQLSLIGYKTYYPLTVEENLVGKTTDELYQQLRDNIENYFPLMRR